MMPITDNIISFAAQKGGSFSRKELLEELRSDAPLNEASLAAILARLVSTGRLLKTGWGEYILSEDVKPRFLVRPREEALGIGDALKERYPLVDFCIWDSFCVVPFMLHVPNVNITVVDVERDLESSFFDALKEMYPRYSVLPHPSKEEFYTYGSRCRKDAGGHCRQSRIRLPSRIGSVHHLRAVLPQLLSIPFRHAPLRPPPRLHGYYPKNPF